MEDQKYKTTRQKPEYVYLNQLNAASKAYIVRVVVAEKGRDILSSKKTVRFQTLLLKDEKGNRMRGTLFGDQIEAFDEALQYLGEYDISAAPIKFIDEKWRTELDQFPYQMTFGSRTVIQPVHPELGPILPNYRPIASIPRAVDPDEKYDVVGVVLFVEEEPRKVEARDGKRESWVREIVITDQSCDRSLTISMWNDLTAGNYFDKLPTWAEAFKVIGFTALKPYTRRGFSMNSAMSTRIIYEPEGEEARVVSDWANLFHQRLVDRQARVLDVRYPSENKKIVSIAELKQKKDAELEKVNAYTSCSNCCKRTNLPMQKRYSCSSCLNKECICTERMITTHSRPFKTYSAAHRSILKLDLLGTWVRTMFWSYPHTQEAEQLSAGYFSQEKDASEKVPENTIESGNSEPFIPTPNLKKNSDKHTQEEPYTETLDTPQQSIKSLKRKKSLGKSPMEFESEESESQVPLSQVGAKKKLCFGGMTTKKDTAGQNPTIPLAKDRVEDVAEPLGSEHRQTTPIIVKTEKVNKPSVESATKEK
ncbi:replication protein A 70 kDa DNA-binding subunit D-like isoform X2 [Chenopodium quinoa]|uniref:replication protein A 70 kDa DNA-binding subunit D-like isoform X2 n=1 Tax=Chenopodium quinoa TaxID=63459 RepID=UPI000B77EA3E|nr:replication protein A 70 kDa DNA-binding subunit D-like isoform X2 [Chenopodium quinoa]